MVITLVGEYLVKKSKFEKEKKERNDHANKGEADKGGTPSLIMAYEVLLDICLSRLAVLQLFSSHYSLCTDKIFIKQDLTLTNISSSQRQTGSNYLNGLPILTYIKLNEIL